MFAASPLTLVLVIGGAYRRSDHQAHNLWRHYPSSPLAVISHKTPDLSGLFTLNHLGRPITGNHSSREFLLASSMSIALSVLFRMSLPVLATRLGLSRLLHLVSTRVFTSYSLFSPVLALPTPTLPCVSLSRHPAQPSSFSGLPLSFFPLNLTPLVSLQIAEIDYVSMSGTSQRYVSDIFSSLQTSTRTYSAQCPTCHVYVKKLNQHQRIHRDGIYISTPGGKKKVYRTDGRFRCERPGCPYVTDDACSFQVS